MSSATKTIVGLLIVGTCGHSQAASPIRALSASARNGQVFLTWAEKDTPDGTTFNVYVAKTPITAPGNAQRVAHHVERHSARDWWEDPASFTAGKPAGEPVGFRIENDGRRLDPRSGLFVYTVPTDARGKLYFAVTSSDPAGKEDATIEVGENSLENGVAAEAGDIQPIWQREQPMPSEGAGAGKALWLNLHAKGGVIPNMEYLVFGDETMGWRPGLPFKFGVTVRKDELIVRPTDRVWINRPHNEAKDGGTPAIWTFWFGYNSKIYDRGLMAEGVPTNYTERRNLWILDWVSRRYRPDPNRWYCSGSSMGGCGTISFGLRHPGLFAGLHALVPIVNYTYLGAGSAHRFEPCCWVGHIPPDLKTSEGVPLLERMDGTRFVHETAADLPPLFLINGRKDGSIPWQNNPPFYRALNDRQQPFAVFWDDGDHATCGKEAPPDVKGWMERFRKLRRDESYPAFSNTSTNRNPGDGRPEDGDVIGWMNRGMDWKEIEDTPREYRITLVADYPGLTFPVRTDVTLRRVQKFHTRPGERLRVRVGDSDPIAVEAGSEGRITIRGVAIPSPAGVRMRVEREG